MRIHFRTVGLVLLAAGVCGTLPAAQKDLFNNGTVRLVPELTISDEALSGGEFLGEIVDMALDGRGCLYVCDAKAKNIKKFDAAGKFLKIIGKGGQGPGEFDYPTELEVYRDRLIVRDLFAARISLFDLDGKFLSTVPVDRSEGSWRRFHPLPDGRFIVETEFVDRSNMNAAQEMRLLLYAADLSYVKTIYRKSVFRNKYISTPVRTNVPLPFAARAFWGLTPDGKIAVGFSGTYEIEILDPDKGKVRSWTHPYKPVEVTGPDKDAFFASLTFGMTSGSGNIQQSKGAPDYIVKNTEFPKTKPAFEKFAVDESRRIWVFPAASDPKAKPAVEVFDSAGAFLGRATLEGDWPPYPPAAAYPGGFWIVTATADEEIKIVKCRIAG